MIATINKDILTVDKGVIVHSVNCIGAVGGLAGAIARKWPKNSQEYLQYVRKQKLPAMLLGNVLDISVERNVIIANLFGQYDISRTAMRTEYAALIQGFGVLARSYFSSSDTEAMPTCYGDEDMHKRISDIYIPYKIGCGLGGGDWNIVEQIIQESFSRSENDVFICRHNV